MFGLSFTWLTWMALHLPSSLEVALHVFCLERDWKLEIQSQKDGWHMDCIWPLFGAEGFRSAPFFSFLHHVGPTSAQQACHHPGCNECNRMPP